MNEARCAGCGLSYSDDGFADLVIPHGEWNRVSPDGAGNGLLCPTCLVRSAARAGIKCHASFRSGPFAMTGEDYLGMVKYARDAASRLGATSLTAEKFRDFADAIEALAYRCAEAEKLAEHWRAVADIEAGSTEGSGS